METNINRYGFGDGYDVNDYIGGFQKKKFDDIYIDPDATYTDEESNFYR